MADLRGSLEAVLFAAGHPVGETELLEIFQTDVETLRETLSTLSEALSERGSGLTIKEAAGGWQMVTRPEHFMYVEKLAQETDRRLSRAA